jgi:hypothetical protein
VAVNAPMPTIRWLSARDMSSLFETRLVFRNAVRTWSSKPFADCKSKQLLEPVPFLAVSKNVFTRLLLRIPRATSWRLDLHDDLHMQQIGSLRKPG